MNLLSLLNHEYNVELTFNAASEKYELRFFCHNLNDVDYYSRLSAEELCVLRENANRIFMAIESKLTKEGLKC